MVINILKIAFIPLITVGETLYSWSARFHRLSGNFYARTTSSQLFGNDRAGLRHDFPSHLNCLESNTNGAIGHSWSLAVERTLLRYFSAFRESVLVESIQAKMCEGSVEKVKSLLGLLPSRVGGFFPLKACSSCIKDDYGKYAFSRWHIEHQWPSTWICRRHRQILWAVRRECQSKDLRKWLLPEDVSDAEKFRIEVSRSMRAKLLKLAEFGAYVNQKDVGYFEELLLRYTYLRQAKGLGWLNTDGSLKLSVIRQRFQKHFARFEVIPGFESIKDIGAAHGGMLGLLMRQYKQRRHPLKHILLCSFLFDSPDQFDAIYSSVREDFELGGIVSLRKSIGWGEGELLRCLVEDLGMSVSGAASQMGISVNVAIKVARQYQIKYKPRPHVTHTELGDEIRKMISNGLSREEILVRSGIKRSMLRAIMAMNSELRDEWRKMDFERRRDTYRANFLCQIGQNSGYTLKKLRMIPGNGVSWLYRKDREWFQNQLLLSGFSRKE